MVGRLVSNFGKVAVQDLAGKRQALPFHQGSKLVSKSVHLSSKPDSVCSKPRTELSNLIYSKPKPETRSCPSVPDIWYLPYRSKSTGIPVFCFWYSVYTGNTVNTLGTGSGICPDCSLECMKIPFGNGGMFVGIDRRENSKTEYHSKRREIKTETTVFLSIVNS